MQLKEFLVIWRKSLDLAQLVNVPNEQGHSPTSRPKPIYLNAPLPSKHKSLPSFQLTA